MYFSKVNEKYLDFTSLFPLNYPSPITAVAISTSTKIQDDLLLKLKKRNEFILKIKLNYELLATADPEFKEDKEFILAVVKQNGKALEFVDSKFKKDKEIVLAAVKQNGWALEFADPELQKDKEIVLAAVKQDGWALELVDPRFKEDKEIVLAAVEQDGRILKFVDPKFQKNKEIVLAAVKQNYRALLYADPELQKDKEIVLAAVKQNGLALKFVDSKFKKDKEIVLAAVKQDSWALEFVDSELQKDREIVLTAVKQNPFVLQLVDPKFKKDKEIVLIAVKQASYALIYADPELKKDKEIVLIAVKQNGMALEYADPELKKDKEIVLAAVKQDPYALRHADPELQKDKEIVLAAVKQDSRVLTYADPELQKDRVFLLLCISKQKNDNILSYVDKDLLKSETFRKEVCACNPLFLLDKNGLNLSLDAPVDENPATLFVKDMTLKIRKPNIQNLLFRMAHHLGENGGIEKVKNLLQKNDHSPKQNSYPKHLQLIALCLKTRFPDKETSPYLDKLKGNDFKDLIKDQNTGLQEALIKLLAQGPCLQEREIQSFFDTLGNPKDLKNHIDRISNFVVLASDEERGNLTEILGDTEGRKEKLIAPCTTFLTTFISPHHLQNLDQIVSNPVSDQLFSYLALHKNNEKIHANIKYLLSAILENKFPEVRYLPNSLHLETLQKNNPEIFSQWKNLSSFAIQTPLEGNENRIKKLNFQDFFLQKLGDNHLHQELAEAIKTKSSFSDDPQKESALSYLNKLRQSAHLPDKNQINTLKTMLREAKLSSDEFEHDLDSLIQKEAAFSKIEVSDNWEDLLLSGVEGSCQRIDGNPNLNRCLLAYLLDGKNQMLCVKNPQGKIVGRSILRLLLNDDQKPCVFMERFYGNSSIQDSIEKGAQEISKKLNLPLYIHDIHRNGLMLHSLGSPVSFEYSDSGGGVTTGVFKHTGCLCS